MKRHMKKAIFVLLGAVFLLIPSYGRVSYAEEPAEGDVYPGGDLWYEVPQTAYEQYLEMLEDPAFSEEECQAFFDRFYENEEEAKKDYERKKERERQLKLLPGFSPNTVGEPVFPGAGLTDDTPQTAYALAPSVYHQVVQML